MISLLTAESIIRAFRFEDLDACGHKLALRMRVGPSEDHVDLTFRQLHSIACGAATQRAGIAGATRVALLMPHSGQLIAHFFAACLAGAVPSILPWPTTKMDAEKYRRNLLGVVKGLGADVLVTSSEMAATLGAALGTTRVLTPAGGAEPFAGAARRPEELAFIQFSGGTTGVPKSVPVTFAQLASQLNAYATALELSADDQFISWLPLYHDMGLITCLVLPFVCRLPVTVFAPLEWVTNPRPFLEAIGANRATLCWLPNFAFSFLAKHSATAAEGLDLSTLRRVVSCSEPVRAESLDAFAARFGTAGLKTSTLHTCYALAEATFAATQSTERGPPRRLEVSVSRLAVGKLDAAPGPTKTLVSCGPAIAGVAIRVVDSKGEDCAERTVGEIWLKGAPLMSGYLTQANDAPDTHALSDGWFHTGDLGSLVDGHLYVTGRKKDLVIVAGVNVYPEDVEAAVSEVAGIHAGRAVAFGLPDEELGTEQLAVVAEVDDAAMLEARERLEGEIRSAVMGAAGLAAKWVFVVPPRWVVKSTAGKISRNDTRARVLEQWSTLVPSSSAAAANPLDGLLARVRAIVQKRLSRRAQLDDSTALYSSGLLDSMTIVELLVELEQAFGITLPGGEVQPNDFDSIAKIAATVARRETLKGRA